MAIALRELFMLFDVKFDSKQLVDGEKETDKAAQKLDKLAQSADKTSKSLDKTEKEAHEASAEIAKTGVSAERAGAGFASFQTHATRIASFLMTTFAFSRMTSMISGLATEIKELNAVGQQTGRTLPEMLAWRSMLGPTGMSVEGFSRSVGNLQANALDAINGSKGQQKAFEDLGLSIDQIRPIVNDSQALFDLYSDAVARTTDQSVRLNSVSTNVGRMGITLIPILQQGSAALRNRRTELMRHTGSIVSFSNHMKDWSKAMGVIKLETMNLTAALGDRLLPMITRLAESRGSLIEFFSNVITNSRLLEIALIAVGVAGAKAFYDIVAAKGALFLEIAAIALIIEDLWVTLEGGDSVISRITDKIFGIGTTASAVQALGDAWHFVYQQITAVGQKAEWVLQHVFEPIERANRTIGQFLGLGMNVSGQREEALDIARRSREITEQRRAQARNADLDRQQGSLRNMSADELALAQVYPSAFGLDRAPTVQQAAAAQLNYTPQTNITIDGAQDPEEVARQVRRVVRDERHAELRRVRTVVDQRRSR